MDFVKNINKLVLIKTQEIRYTRRCPDKGAPRSEVGDQVCAQKDNLDIEPVPGKVLPSTPLGIPPSQAQLALQTDVCKELVNKIAWVLGSVYRQNYSNMRSPARQYAWRIVKKVLEDHGYPAKISK